MKAIKTTIVILVIILAIIICYKYLGTETTNEIIENEVVNTEEVEEVKNEVEDEVVNEVDTITNEIDETPETTVDNTTTKSNVYESNSDVGTTNKKEEAINLVKEKWGEDSAATFRCDSVRDDGTYIIAVVKGGKVQNYFKVNLETKSVEIDY